MSQTGQVLEISLRTWDIVRWLSLREFIGPADSIDRILVVPEAHMLWVRTAIRKPQGRDEEVVRVVDLDERRVRREFSRSVTLHRVESPRGSLVAMCDLDRGNALYLPHGQAVAETRRRVMFRRLARHHEPLPLRLEPGQRQPRRAEQGGSWLVRVSLAQVAGLTAKDVHELYMKKNRVNFQRQDTGYAVKDESDNDAVKLGK